MLRTIFERLSNAISKNIALFLLKSTKMSFMLYIKINNVLIHILNGLTSLFIFSSGEEESKWESSTARNAASFKEKVESGKIVPTEIRKKLEQKENRTVVEQSMLEKEKFVANRLEKVGFVLLHELEGFRSYRESPC